MKASTKDMAKGKFRKAKGKAIEKVGRAIGKPQMENEGENDQMAGRVQEKIGQVERIFEQ